MIIMRVMGGLGNQMFQYALGRRLAIERNVPLKLDLSWFATQKKRKFGLDQFNIKAEVATEEEVYRLHYFSHNRYFRKAYSIIQNHLPVDKKRIINERKAGLFDKDVLRSSKNCLLVGYWQSESYFEKITKLIKKEFQPRTALGSEDILLAKKMRKNPYSVSVHIRRGDYVSPYRTIATHYICTPDYYTEAIDFLKQKLGGKAELFIFSDDPEWCKKEFLLKDEKYQIISGTKRTPSHELVLMSQCNHHIIPNSSFSWWGAWLSQNPKKIIVSPTEWLRNHKTPEIVPNNWIRYKHNDKNDWKYVDIPYAKSRYFSTFKRELNLDSPVSFNEKIQWLKIYDRKPIYTTLADKYAVRSYVEEKVGSGYLNELIGVYDTVEEIDFQQLPDKFVLKATHGCGWNIICKDKNKFNKQHSKKVLSKWLDANYYYLGREWVYKDIEPKIICEKYLEGDKTLGLLDYKFWCFHGTPKFVQVSVGRFTDHYCRFFFDENWKIQPFNTGTLQSDNAIQQPAKLDEMLSVVRKLTKGFPFSRVDLYNSDGKITFGEITFYPYNGFIKFIPEHFDQILGKEIKLDHK